ncbi:MAG TPA: DUF4419 domain-containing protein, partial [Dactylosporangium sp.]|nr:DUF4419 domain-containing protein [Dactylosporangium sp.]
TWCRSLALITDEFVSAASGSPDPQFWRRIYNPIDAYGGDVITGWVARFYPYLKGATVDVPNPLLDLPIDEPCDVTVRPGDFYSGPGIDSTAVPSTLSRVVVNINDRTSGDNRAVALHAGLVAVAQDPDGALRPVAGWYVAPAPIEIDDVIDRLVREHHTTPPQDLPDEGPAEAIALYRRIGSATLFDGRWRLVPRTERRDVDCDDPELWIETLIDLADGHTIASATDPYTMITHWVLCRVAEIDGPGQPRPRFRLADDPADVAVLGTSLAMLLNAALDSGGDVAHLETGRLNQLGTPAG